MISFHHLYDILSSQNTHVRIKAVGQSQGNNRRSKVRDPTCHQGWQIRRRDRNMYRSRDGPDGEAAVRRR